MKKFKDLLFPIGFTCVLFFASWLLINHLFQSGLIQQQEAYLVKKADLLLTQLDDTPFTNQHVTAAQKNLIAAFLEKEDERVTLLDADGDIIFDSNVTDLTGTRSKRPEVNKVLETDKNSLSIRYSTTLKTELLYVALPILQDGQRIGILRVAEKTAGFNQEAETFRRGIFFILLIFYAILGVLLIHLFRQRNRPLETVLPVLRRMIDAPAQNSRILQDSPQWHELYLTVNQLGDHLRKTHAAYNDTETQFTTLLQELTIGVFVIGHDQKIQLINQAMEEILAVTDSQGRSYLEVIQDPKLIQAIHYLTPQQQQLHEEISLTVPIKRRAEVSLRYLSQGAEFKVMGIVYDLTRIRHLEKIQQDFVSNVSHELKTPVTSLIGFTETLLDGAMKDPQLTEEFLLIIQQDAHRLQDLIQEIIMLSKDTLLEKDFEAVELQQFFQQLVHTYQKMIAQKGLTVEIRGEHTQEFQTQLAFFQPIAKNLLENAINYSTQGGQITITFETEDCLRFSVRDHGIGIDQDDFNRIFERFYRVDKARARNSGGTGLGLAIVKEYTERLGGFVEVTSHLGVGSVFTVTLPLTPLDRQTTRP